MQNFNEDEIGLSLARLEEIMDQLHMEREGSSVERNIAHLGVFVIYIDTKPVLYVKRTDWLNNRFVIPPEYDYVTQVYLDAVSAGIYHPDTVVEVSRNQCNECFIIQVSPNLISPGYSDINKLDDTLFNRIRDLKIKERLENSGLFMNETFLTQAISLKKRIEHFLSGYNLPVDFDVDYAYNYGITKSGIVYYSDLHFIDRHSEFIKILKD